MEKKKRFTLPQIQLDTDRMQREIEALQQENSILRERLKLIVDTEFAVKERRELEEANLEEMRRQADAIHEELEGMRRRELEHCREMLNKARNASEILLNRVNARIRQEWEEHRRQMNAERMLAYGDIAEAMHAIHIRRNEYIRNLHLQMALLDQAEENAVETLIKNETPIPENRAALYDAALSAALSTARFGRVMYEAEEDAPADADAARPVLEFMSLDDINALGSFGFRNNIIVSRIVLPEGLTSIGPSFFYGCSNLEEVVIPSTLEEIGDFAFYGCGRLKTIDLTRARSLRRIGDYAFSICSDLVSLSLPASVEELGTGAFRYCMKLRNVGLCADAKLRKLGSHAFQYCAALQRFAIPDTVTEIPTSLFYGCESIGELIIPKNVKSIGEFTVHGCTSLRRIVVHAPEEILSKETFATLQDCDIVLTDRDMLGDRA